MKATHTPGPWRVGDAGATVFGPPNGEPAPLVIAVTKPARGAYRANARLIAAAPAMRELLTRIAQRMDDLTVVLTCDEWDEIDAVLATIDGTDD